MSGLELLADEVDGRLHVAVIRKGRLENLYVDPKDMSGCWASLYLGKVVKVDPKIDAAIVDLGGGLQGFLPAKHIHLPGVGEEERRTGIADLLKAGQAVTVQVKAEAKKDSAHAHRKLPRLTTKIYTFGPLLVHAPTSAQVAVSRGITDEKLIAFTAKLKGKGGWIVQKNAEGAPLDDVTAEAKSHLAEWKDLMTAREAGGNVPRLLRAGPHAVARALNDYGAGAFGHIHAGNRVVFDLVSAWAAKFQPALATSKRLRLFRPSSPGEKLFDMHDVFSELEVLNDAHVPLNGGGSLIIEPTQAFVVIDVNQGSGGAIPAVNTEAAREVARQAKLRNLSGAILIDFINMEQRMERSKLVDLVTSLFADDFGSAAVHGFTRLGIMEVTRKRRGAFVSEKLKF